MEETRHMMMPYIVHESSMARAERTIRRLWILAIIFIILFLVSNLFWVTKFTAPATDKPQQTVQGEELTYDDK